MLVLIATDELLGSGPNEHHHAVDGELVSPVVFDCPDPHCDVCARAWFGLVSDRPTTSAMVVDRPGVDDAALRRRIHDWLDRRGVVDLVVQAIEDGDPIGGACDDPVAVVDELVMAHVREIHAICETFEIGTVVSRLGPLVAPRRLDMAA